MLQNFPLLIFTFLYCIILTLKQPKSAYILQ